MAHVSVAVPTYNRVHYLRQCLMNLKAQDSRDFSVLVLDNGSTDASPKVYLEIVGNDERFQYYRHQETVTAQENFRCGLDMSTAEYFMWRADDDLSDTNFISALSDALDKDSRADLAVCPFSRRFGESGREDYHLTPPSLEGLQFPHKSARLLRSSGYPVWIYGLWRKSTLLHNFKMFNSIDYPWLWASDYALMLPTLLSGAVCVSLNTKFEQRIVGEASYFLPPTELLKARQRYLEFGNSLLEQMQLNSADKKILNKALLEHTQLNVALLWKTRRKAAYEAIQNLFHRVSRLKR
ncbi:MAG: glycosyltransferase family 2 protein [Aestuariivirga sp.]